MSSKIKASNTIGLSHKRENLFLFVDWANAYKQGRKLHTPASFATSKSREHIYATEEKQSSAVIAKEPSTISKGVEEQNMLTTEQLLAEYVHGLRKHGDTSSNTIKRLFNILEHINRNGAQATKENLNKVLGYREELEAVDTRKQFMEKYLSKTAKKCKSDEFYLLRPNYLQQICCQWDKYAPLPKKEHCFLFVSHRPGEKEKFESKPVYKRMITKYTVKLYERIATSTERKLLIKEDGSSEVFVREREKGVDVSLAVEVTKVICKAVEKAENEKIHVVLVSGDSDFRPVIEYAVENKVLVDVWGWEAGVSSVYKEFLQQNSETGVRLFYLDRYLYQVGFVYRPRTFVSSQQGYVFSLHHRFEIVFWYTDKSRGDDLSHYILSERLTRYTNSIKECDEELEQLQEQYEQCRKDEQNECEDCTQELGEDDFLPRESPLLMKEPILCTEEQKSSKSKTKELKKKKQNVKLKHSEKIHQSSIAIEQSEKKKEKLVEEHQEKKKNKEALDFETYHFKIYWSKDFFTIGFCDEALRSAFLDYLENSTEELCDQLKRYPKKTRVVSDDEIRQKAEEEKREAKQTDGLIDEDEESDDDGICFKE